MIFHHDCPGDILRWPISYCTHGGWRVYFWLGPSFRFRFRLRFSEPWQFPGSPPPRRRLSLKFQWGPSKAEREQIERWWRGPSAA